MFNKCIMCEGIKQWINSWMKGYIILLTSKTYGHFTITHYSYPSSEPYWDPTKARRLAVHCIYIAVNSLSSCPCIVTWQILPPISGDYLSNICIWVSHAVCFGQWVIGKHTSKEAFLLLLLWKPKAAMWKAQTFYSMIRNMWPCPYINQGDWLPTTIYIGMTQS